MKASIKGGTLFLEIPINTPATPTSTGKSLMVATTKGNIKTELVVDGKPLTVSVNAYIAKD